MAQPDGTVLLLRNILENLNTPEQLDQHAWVQKLFVKEFCERDPALAALPPGRQLIAAVFEVFRKMQPAMPPKRGLRLDTRWGEFGLLAAQYFAPYLFGIPVPASLREAWQGIDRAILLMVFNRESDISAEQRQCYQLVSAERETAPNSTISDWHRKGLEWLAEALMQYESHLEARNTHNPSPVLPADSQKKQARNRVLKQGLRWFTWLLVLVAAIMLIGGAWKGWQIYQRLQTVWEDAQALQGLSLATLDFKQINAAGEQISALRADLAALQNEAAPFLPLAPYLGWVPVYGGDLSQSAHLLEMGVQLSITGDDAFQSVSPALQSMSGTDSAPHILDLLSNLKDADTKLLAAQAALSSARAARQQVQPDLLSKTIRDLLTRKIDPLLLSLEGAFPVDDVLSMARLTPRLLGAVGNGPQTYMILAQNEDELRPTGGFLTAVGTMVVENGKVERLSFESSDVLDDLSKPYPKAPWTLEQSMRAEMLLLLDANWFTNFPTTVEWTKFLYAYTRSKSVDGVIAIDQHVLVELLRDVGPIKVEGMDEPVSADNVLGLMRASKQQTPPPGVSRQEWDRKQFIGRLAEPLFEKLMAGDRAVWQPLIRTMIQLLDEKHILLQFNDPEMSALLSRRGWDGAVRPTQGSDFLMVVDSNVGFNKTSLVMQTSLAYQLDLSDPARPVGGLTVKQTNNAILPKQDEVPCIQAKPIATVISQERDYLITACYWSYLRVYTPAGSELLASTPHAIPAAWPLREQAIPARTDLLQDEGIPGVQAFGTLVVVPIQQTIETSFTYQLPAGVLKYDPQNHTWRYQLTVQKQPGTLAQPFIFSLKLPAGAAIVTAPPELRKTGDTWVWETDLHQDLRLEIVFRADK